MVLHIQNYIGGQWVDAASGETFESVNPATEETVAHVALAAEAEVQAAVAAAREAYRGWRLLPAPRRGEILFEVAAILKARKDEIARIATAEMGKVLDETRGDVQEAIDMAYYMGGEGRRLMGYTAPVEMPNKFGMALRDSVGIVGVITPWNFPVAVPSWKILPALIAGNTIVFKPGEDTPATAAAFVRVFEDAGLPAGVLNLVHGAGPVGHALVSHPDVRVISFTGSNQTGLGVYTTAAGLGKKVTLEMGGKNAILVMDDANLELAVEAITWSAYGTTGQRCTATSRLIVQKGIKQRLVERLIEKGRSIRIGNGLEAGVTMGPLVNQRALDKVASYMDIARAEGVEIVLGGQRADTDKGFFFLPTLFDRVRPGMRVEREEIFGPVLSVIEVESLEEAIEVNNASAFGLSSSIFTENVNAAFRAIRDLTTGIVYINHGTTGAEIQFPFGGTRGTGNGMREAGKTALDSFTEWKSVYVDFSGKLQRAQIDTESALDGLDSSRFE
jgi:alpha-ketoglutaric semialdehyde dehydrogenase